MSSTAPRRAGVRLGTAALALVCGTALAACGSTDGSGRSAPTSPATSRATSPVTAAPTTSGTTSGTPSASTSATAAAPVLRVRRLPWHLRVPVAREAAIVTGSDVVLAGGLVGADSSTAAAWRVDVARGRVRALPDLPVPVHDTAGVALGGVPLVLGGGNAAEQSAVQRLGPTGWRVAGHLPGARSDLGAAVVDDRAVVVGGYDGSRVAEPAVLTSADGVHWRTTGLLAVPVRYAATAVADGALWVLGGERAGVEQRTIQRVDPATGRTRVVGRLPVALGHASAVTLGDRVLLLGGHTGPDTMTARTWWFDPATARTTPAGRLPAALADAAVATVGDTTYVLGGESPHPTTQVLAITYR